MATALMLLASVDSTAQSTDRDNPTQLMSGEISGLIDSESKGNVYYYKFTVNPGEVTITLSVQSNPDNSGINSVTFTLFDRNAEAIAEKTVASHYGGGTGQTVARINITRRQEVVLGINIRGGVFNAGGGRYRLRISGSVETNQNAPAAKGEPVTPEAFDRILTGERTIERGGKCFPPKGTLILKMKDGSKKIIDLSEAESVTIVP